MIDEANDRILTPHIDPFWASKAQIIVDWLESKPDIGYLAIDPPVTMIYLSGASTQKQILTRRKASIHRDGKPQNQFCWYAIDQEGREVWSHIIHAEQ